MKLIHYKTILNKLLCTNSIINSSLDIIIFYKCIYLTKDIYSDTNKSFNSKDK